MSLCHTILTMWYLQNYFVSGNLSTRPTAAISGEHRPRGDNSHLVSTRKALHTSEGARGMSRKKGGMGWVGAWCPPVMTGSSRSVIGSKGD